MLSAAVSSSLAGPADEKAKYLSDTEREVLAEINLARASPKKYADYLAEHRRRFTDDFTYRNESGAMVRTQEGVKAVDEAIAFLKSAKAIKALRPSEGLSLAARDHVGDIGKSGITEHTGADKSTPKDRIERYGKWEKTMGENISFGMAIPRCIVMQLIIDDGIKERGHRANIFNPAFSLVGIACGPHSGFRNVCVTDFAGGYRDMPDVKSKQKQAKTR